MAGRTIQKTAARTFLAGFAVLVHVGVAVMLFGATAFVASPIGAQGTTVCFSRDECLAVNGGTAPAGGNCTETRCFEPGASGCRSGQGKCYAKWPKANLAISIGGTTQVLDFADYVARAYNYGVSIATILAGIMLMVGGFQYLTAGDSGRVSQAKDRIRDALIGLLLTLGAWLVLFTINPDIVALRLPKIELVRKRTFVGCKTFEYEKRCGEKFFLAPRTDAPPNAEEKDRFRILTKEEVDAGQGGSECIGRSCSKAGDPYSDATHRCRRDPNQAPPEGDVEPPATGPVAPYACMECGGHGSDCTGLGPSVECCGGFCSAADRTTIQAAGGIAGGASAVLQLAGIRGRCSNGNNRVACAVDAECFSGKCANLPGTSFGGACTAGLVGSPCDSNNDCESGVCDNNYDVCTTPVIGSPCDSDSDCGGLGCNDDEDTCGPRWTCDDDSDCTGNAAANAAGATQCVDIPDDTDELCVARAVGAHCDDSSDCPGDSYCCEACGRICINAVNGATCTQDSDCTRGGRRGLCSIASPATGGVGGGPGVCSSGLTPGAPCVNRGGLHGCPTGYDCVRNVYRCVEQTGGASGDGGGV